MTALLPETDISVPNDVRIGLCLDGYTWTWNLAPARYAPAQPEPAATPATRRTFTQHTTPPTTTHPYPLSSVSLLSLLALG
jgi:hypothetical protein